MHKGKWPRRNAMAAALVASFGGSAFAAPGDPLGPPLAIATESSGNYYLDPAIARDAAGDGVVVWKNGSGVRAQRLGVDGMAKGSPIVVDTTPYSGVPDVAMDATGDFVVTWAQIYVTATSGIYAQRYHADGSPEGAQLKVAVPPDVALGNAYVLNPSVAMDDDGDFVVAWGQGRELSHGSWYSCGYGIGICTQIGAYSVQMRRYTGGGAQAQSVQTVDSTGAGAVEVLVPLAIGSTEGQVSVAMAPDGRFVVAWDHQSEGVSLLSGIYARTYDANGKAGLKRVVSSQRSQGFPDVAMDASGAYVVTYSRQSRALNDYSQGIYLRRFPGGSKLGSAESRIDTGPGMQAYNLGTSVTMDAAGDFVVAWSAGGRIYAQRYASGGGALGINFDVSGDPPNEYGAFAAPDVAMDPSGNFAVVWSAAWSEYPSGPLSEITYTRIDARFYDGP